MTNYGRCCVTDYFNKNDVRVVFLDTGYTGSFSAGCLKRGHAKDPLRPKVYGVGILGVGDYACQINGIMTPQYACWKSMLGRIYCRDSKNKYPSYSDVSVKNDWLNYQVFSAWFDTSENAGMPGFELDKDLRQWGQREYGPDTCSFVPKEINSLFGGARLVGPMAGIEFDQRGKSYSARISRSGVVSRLGIFSSKNEAQSAYICAKIDYAISMADKYKRVIHPQVFMTISSLIWVPECLKKFVPELNINFEPVS